MLILLTRAKSSSSLTTLNIKYINDLPEYPITHIYGHTYVVASKGQTQVEMEHLADSVSACQALGNWLLSISRSNMQNDSLLDENDLFTVHFLDVKSKNGHGDALGFMHVNSSAQPCSLIIIHLLINVHGKRSKSLRKMSRS
jgi:hypothetical protein